MLHVRKIENSTPEDLPTILDIYQQATAYQREKQGVVVWPRFDANLVRAELSQLRQWKLVIDTSIACVWATARSDRAIWGPRDQDDALYLHRIATCTRFRGKGLVQDVVDWARSHATQQDIDFVRLDTVGNNLGLIALYKKAGFRHLGGFKLNDPSALPSHYTQGDVQLFEIDLRTKS